MVEGHLQLLAVLPKNKSLYQFQRRHPGHFVTGGNSPRSDVRITVLVKLLQLKGFHGF